MNFRCHITFFTANFCDTATYFSTCFAYKGLIIVDVHDQLLDRPATFQCFFQILRDHPILRAGDHQKLVDVAAHTPHLADQRGHIGRRDLLDLRARI